MTYADKIKARLRERDRIAIARESLNQRERALQRYCDHPFAQVLLKDGKGTGLAHCSVCNKIVED